MSGDKRLTSDPFTGINAESPPTAWEQVVRRTFKLWKPSESDWLIKKHRYDPSTANDPANPIVDYYTVPMWGGMTFGDRNHERAGPIRDLMKRALKSGRLTLTKNDAGKFVLAPADQQGTSGQQETQNKTLTNTETSAPSGGGPSGTSSGGLRGDAPALAALAGLALVAVAVGAGDN